MHAFLFAPPRRRLGAWRRWVALVLCATALGAAAQMPRHDSTPAPQPRVKTDLATSAAFAPDGALWVIGLDTGKRLVLRRAASLQPLQWSAPQPLDTGSDTIAADGENRPKIAFGPKGWVVVSYTQPLDAPFTGFIRLLRSADGGRSFSPPVTVHQDRQAITHRFEAIGFDGEGVLHTVWIDKRDRPPPGSEQRYVGAAIYHNRSTDGGASFGPDTKLADHSCECCRIALAPDSQGRLHAMWRHIFDDQVRDHAFAALDHPAPNQFTRATYDEWQIRACPHHGPGLAPAQGAEPQAAFHAIWFGLRPGDGPGVAPVRYGRLDATGQPVAGSLRPLPDPRAEHADVAAHGPRVAVVWRSFDGERTALKAWLSQDGGKTFALRTLAQAAGENDHPRLAQQGGKIVVVWRLPQEIQVHELVF